MTGVIKETVTDYFSIRHATIKWEDSPNENVEFLELQNWGETIRLHNINEESWRVTLNRNDEAILRRNHMPDDGMRVISVDSIDEIEVNWVEDLVAVATVDVEVRRERGWIRTKEERRILTDEPDVTVWDRDSWEES